MVTLWTDIVDPAELTGYTREALADYELTQGTLARWLPNRTVNDIVVRFNKGDTGLVDIAEFRAYDAEPTIGAPPTHQRVTIELPAIGRMFPVSEYNQLRARGNASEDVVRVMIENTARRAARAVADAIEKLRGVVLQTGKATVSGFMDDDFGRDAGHTTSASTAWSDATWDILAEVSGWSDTYLAANGERPGAAIISTRVLRAIAKSNQFKTALASGGNRPATQQQVMDTFEGAGLPPLYVYDRQVSVAGSKTKVLSDDRFIMVPPPVDPNDPDGTDLGATTWGQTLSSMEADWNIPDAEQPGLVIGAFRNETPPMIAQVHSDAIALPHLANANLSFAADVL